MVAPIDDSHVTVKVLLGDPALPESSHHLVG